MDFNEPIPAFDTRYPDKLESCLQTPFQKFNGKDLYPGLVKKAAIFFYLLNKNHPFKNGNKRISVVGLLYFLLENGKYLKTSQRKIYQLAVSVSASEAREKDKVVKEIELFIKTNLVDSPDEYRPIKN